MSKKNKNKFKKQIKAQMLEEMTQAPAIQKENSVNAKSQPSIEAKTITQPTAMSAFNLPQIKYDLKKTSIVILILTALIVGLYFTDLKYGLLTHFGTWLFKVLNIHN